MIAAVTSRPGGRTSRIEAGDPMPFGKHKGIPIEQVPADYLKWALQNADVCNPDHDRYWPELKQVLESLVGPHAPARPRVLPIAELCDRLKEEGVMLLVRGDELVASEPPPAELMASIQAHANLLYRVLLVGQGTKTIATGQARSDQACELRGLIKRWFRRMALQNHPDHGGSVERQAAINLGHKALQEMITEWEAGS